VAASAAEAPSTFWRRRMASGGTCAGEAPPAPGPPDLPLQRKPLTHIRAEHLDSTRPGVRVCGTGTIAHRLPYHLH
jgi:hypothetical protein